MPIVDQPLYRERELHLEDLSLSELGSVVGTPVYVYSQAALLSRASAFVESAPERSLVCYAVKANSNPHLLRMLVEAGLGADVTSGGELFLAQHVGFDPKKILFSGVGKTELEMEQALDVGVRALHVESEQELHLLARVAAERGKIASCTCKPRRRRQHTCAHQHGRATTQIWCAARACARHAPGGERRSLALSGWAGNAYRLPSY